MTPNRATDRPRAHVVRHRSESGGDSSPSLPKASIGKLSKALPTFEGSPRSFCSTIGLVRSLSVWMTIRRLARTAVAAHVGISRHQKTVGLTTPWVVVL